MARPCGACGRDLDGVEHELLRNDKGEAIRVPVVAHRGRGRVGIRRQRIYGCRVRLIARSPVTGKVLPVSFPDRNSELQNAYVHVSRLQPGKDLHTA